MATCKENGVLCAICEAQHITKAANLWCPECEEGLCCECEKQHNVSKSSRNHRVIPIADYLNIPKPILEIVHHCSEHDRKYQMFCTRHDDLCCPLCISSYHKDCTGLLAIEEMVKISHSTLIESTETVLNDLITNVDEVIKNRKQNLEKIKEKRKVFQGQINKMRNRLVSHIAKLEKQALNDLDRAEKKISSQIQHVLTTFMEKSKVVNEYQNNIAAMKKYASHLQIYLGLKTVAQNIQTEEKQIKLLFEETNLQQFEMKCTINESLASSILNLNSFGSLQTDVAPASVVFKSSIEKQAQMFSNSHACDDNHFDSVRLALDKSFKIVKGKSVCKITGCTMMSCGNMIFADCDPNKRLVITGIDGTSEREISLSPTRPYGVFEIDENNVAVSTWNPNEIQVINFKTTKTEKKYNAQNIRGGLVYLSSKWIYRDYNGLAALQESDQTISTFVKQTKQVTNPSDIYLAALEDRVFTSNNEENTVICYGLDGKLIWEYKNDKLLIRPLGITVDNNSNVYVLSSLHKTILIISSDGSRGRHLFDTNFFSVSPRVIHFDKRRNKLLVVSEAGCVYLFNVM